MGLGGEVDRRHLEKIEEFKTRKWITASDLRGTNDMLKKEVLRRYQLLKELDERGNSDSDDASVVGQKRRRSGGAASNVNQSTGPNILSGEEMYKNSNLKLYEYKSISSTHGLECS